MREWHVGVCHLIIPMIIRQLRTSKQIVLWNDITLKNTLIGPQTKVTIRSPPHEQKLTDQGGQFSS